MFACFFLLDPSTPGACIVALFLSELTLQSVQKIIATSLAPVWRSGCVFVSFGRELHFLCLENAVITLYVFGRRRLELKITKISGRVWLTHFSPVMVRRAYSPALYAALG